jgi:phosphoribosyl-AMP cyclohydrolase
MTDKKEIEEGTAFTPKFAEDGLMPVITISAKTGKVLMLAYMNREALDKTLETHEAHYWSRSRNELWHKGATSGHIQKVISIKTDCDQDTLLLTVEMTDETSCHTGRESCFYREVDLSEGSMLRFVKL